MKRVIYLVKVIMSLIISFATNLTRISIVVLENGVEFGCRGLAVVLGVLLVGLLWRRGI